MNKQNLKKALAAGIFAATIITITACGGGGGGGGSSTASTKITTVAGGGGYSTTTSDATQARLGVVYTIVANGDYLLFNSNRVGVSNKLQRLNLVTNKLATPEDYSGTGPGEKILDLIAATADSYYFFTAKTVSASVGFPLLYAANNRLEATLIAGNKDSTSNGTILDNANGKLARFHSTNNQAVIYTNQNNDKYLFIVDDVKIRSVALSGSYNTETVKASSEFKAWRLALNGDKLVVLDIINHLIYEHDIATRTEKLIAGSKGSGGYVNSENPEQARIQTPYYIATSPSGNIYFTVYGVKSRSQKIIRKLAVSNGVYGGVTTAFGAAPGSEIDRAELGIINEIEFVGNNLYVLDFDGDIIGGGGGSNYHIKKIEFINQTP